MKALTIQQVRARFNKEKPRFVGLKNDKGQFVVPMNTPKIKPADRIKEMERFFDKESTPDGVYYFITKESLVANHPEIETPVAKGKVTDIVLKEKPSAAIITAKTEDVWDLRTALDKSIEIVQLTMENKQLKEENADLRKQIQELSSQLGEEDENKQPDMNKTIEGVRNLLQTIAPSIDRHFDLKKEELDVKRLQIQVAQSIHARQSNEAQRDDGGVPVNDPRYEEYFKLVCDEGTEEQFDYECDYLERTNPELYQEFAVKYEIEVQPEGENDGKGS